MTWIEKSIKIAKIAIFTIYRTIKVVIRGIINKETGNYFYEEMKLWSDELLNSIGVEIIIEGLSNINVNSKNVNTKKSYIYIANHTNLLDIVILIKVLSADKINFMYRQSLQKVPVLGFALKHSPFIPIIRENAKNSNRGIERAVETLDRNGSVIIFPEGTRSRTGKIANFKRGAFILSLQSKKQIVPISIAGVENITPADNGLRLNKGKVIVNIASPVEIISDDRTELNKIISDIRQAMIEIKKVNSNKIKL